MDIVLTILGSSVVSGGLVKLFEVVAKRMAQRRDGIDTAGDLSVAAGNLAKSYGESNAELRQAIIVMRETLNEEYRRVRVLRDIIEEMFWMVSTGECSREGIRHLRDQYRNDT